MIEQFYLSRNLDANRYNHSKLERTEEELHISSNSKTGASPSDAV